MEQPLNLPELTDETVKAVYGEMVFWLYIFSDHLKFLRSGLDPAQEELFRVLDERTYRMDRLIRDVSASGGVPSQLTGMIEHVQAVAVNTRDFKHFMTEAITSCRVLSIVPPVLANHMRREVDFFIAVTRGSLGLPMPQRQVLDIPDGNVPLGLTARQLLNRLNEEQKFSALWEELVFWSIDMAEHGGYLAGTFKPDQGELRRRAQMFERNFEQLFRRVTRMRSIEREYIRFRRYAFELAEDFRSYLSDFSDSQRQCSIQTNTWPKLSDHMIRETDYFIDVLRIEV